MKYKKNAKMQIEYNSVIPSYDLKCFQNKKILKKIKNIFKNENIDFTNDWRVTDIPVNIKEYIIVDLYNQNLNKSINFIFYSNNTVDICLYDEKKGEDIKYNTLKEVLYIQSMLTLSLYEDENIIIFKIKHEYQDTFLLYWYDVKYKKDNIKLNIDIRKLNAYKIINPSFDNLLINHKTIVPAIINLAIKNNETATMEEGVNV